MEPDGPLPIDHEGARRALDARGATLNCPSCGTDGWRNLGELGTTTVVLPCVNAEGQTIQIGRFQSIVRAFAFICANCGFIRLHHIDELIRAANESADEAP
jgi:hypothetical protein